MAPPSFFRPWILPRIDRNRRVSALIWGYLGFSTLYLVLGRYPLLTPATLAPGAVDALIPFLEATLPVYFSHYPYLLLCLWSHPEDGLRSRGYYAMLLASAVAFAFFLVLPTRVERLSPDPDGFWAPAWEALFRIDAPTNAFPSLHVALSAVALLAVWSSRWAFRWWALPWGLLIWISTLTTKQHLFVDMVGGLLLACLCWWATPRLATFRGQDSRSHIGR